MSTSSFTVDVMLYITQYGFLDGIFTWRLIANNAIRRSLVRLQPSPYYNVFSNASTCNMISFCRHSQGRQTYNRAP